VDEFIVDVSAAGSWGDFIAAFNTGFVSHVGGKWNGNLDALNDYLFWPEKHPYRLIVRGWAACAPAVNRHFAPDGRPILDVVSEIIQDNPQVIAEID
jgi:hypothetical protein